MCSLSVDELAISLDVPISWVESQARKTGPDSIPAIEIDDDDGVSYCFDWDHVMDWLQENYLIFPDYGYDLEPRLPRSFQSFKASLED